MKRVLVLDACQRSALAVTRSLGQHGVPVITADDCPSSLAGSSRFSLKYHRYRPPQLDTAGFLQDIKSICCRQSIDMVLPMTEMTTNLLLHNKRLLPTSLLPFPEIETVNRISDKCSLLHIAEKCDVPIPTTRFFNGIEQAANILDDFAYPLILKPGKSWVESGEKWLHTRVHTANSATEAHQILQTDPAFSAYPFMLQEFVTGLGQGVFALYDQGQPLAFFAHQRIREKPPQGGVSVLSKSVPVDPVLKGYTRNLLDSVRWHGVAMVEFKVNATQAYLMEINTRFWGSLQLAIDAGVDFPWLLYQMASGISLQPVNDYTKDNQLRWLLGDLDRLYLVLKNSKFSKRDKISTLLRFFTPGPRKTRHEVNRLNDIRPFLWELKKYLKDVF